MTAPLRRIIRICAGGLLILLGIAGLFLPFLQGIALIAAGVFLLAPNSRLALWLRRTARHAMARLGCTIRGWKGALGRKLRGPFKWMASRMRQRKEPDSRKGEPPDV